MRTELKQDPTRSLGHVSVFALASVKDSSTHMCQIVSIYIYIINKKLFQSYSKQGQWMMLLSE